ncbi:MAG TPA: CstA-like transporter-associated (seleno)protein [Candidatus Dormibacteraeota bacterium]|nr:CstA-like transporter-associated (seleno)protein [Candidatus Dormibacteraeota bacterium]
MKASGDLAIGRSDDLKGRRPAASYQGSGFSRAIEGKNTWASAAAVMNRVMQTIRATLREIFDESAYERYLLRTHASRSVASYRAFTLERDAAMLKKPRCC